MGWDFWRQAIQSELVSDEWLAEWAGGCWWRSGRPPSEVFQRSGCRIAEAQRAMSVIQRLLEGAGTCLNLWNKASKKHLNRRVWAVQVSCCLGMKPVPAWCVCLFLAATTMTWPQSLGVSSKGKQLVVTPKTSKNIQKLLSKVFPPRSTAKAPPALLRLGVDFSLSLRSFTAEMKSIFEEAVTGSKNSLVWRFFVSVFDWRDWNSLDDLCFLFF